MEHNNDIFWHALNYRTAAPPQAEQMWQELDACVKRLIAEEREACAEICEDIGALTTLQLRTEDGSGIVVNACLRILVDVMRKIRERSNVELRGDALLRRPS